MAKPGLEKKFSPEGEGNCIYCVGFVFHSSLQRRLFWQADACSVCNAFVMGRHFEST